LSKLQPFPEIGRKAPAKQKPTPRHGVEETKHVLGRIRRGLVSYISYLQACDMAETFSEHLLYETILRILTARRFTVTREAPCPGIELRPGERTKRLDFVAYNSKSEFALEVKWKKDRHPNLKSDIAKLQAYVRERPRALGLLCVFGTEADMLKFTPPIGVFYRRGTLTTAKLVGTSTVYSCAVFELKRPKPATSKSVLSARTRKPRTGNEEFLL
jgi:hypothetical protein